MHVYLFSWLLLSVNELLCFPHVLKWQLFSFVTDTETKHSEQDLKKKVSKVHCRRAAAKRDIWINTSPLQPVDPPLCMPSNCF